MRAYYILMFLFIFNMFVWVLSSLSIYNVNYANPEFQPPSNPSLIDQFLVSFDILGIKYSGISALIFALSAGAMIGFFKASLAPQSVVYAVFGTLFWLTYIKSITVFWNIVKDVPGTIVILSVVTTTVGLVFIVGLLQMVTGGWKSYE